MVAAGGCLALSSSACEPELIVGKVTNATACPAYDPGDGVAGATSEGKTVDVPWETGFESGFCDYASAGGFCYGDSDATYLVVDSPVRSGRQSAAFSVTSDPSRDGVQTRCFLEGTLPLDATYGAWFYVPALAQNMGNWNLVHFQGGDGPPRLRNLWDVSLGNADDGSLYLYIFDSVSPAGVGGIRIPPVTRPVPIGAWFHVEFRLRRATDATGIVALRQDGALLLELTDLVTDPTLFGQWYVGNLVTDDALTPQDSTIYVDDVTVRPAP